MTIGDFVLEIPKMVDIPLAAKRTAEAKTHDWPAGTRIVSADSHMLERDCWFDRFPEALKDKAPRIEFKDGAYHFSLDGQPMVPAELANLLCEAMECNPGLTNVRGPASRSRHRGCREGAHLSAAPLRPLHHGP